MAKISSSLPKGHGLGVAARRLSEGDPVIALVVLRRQKRVQDYEKGETELIAKISEVEAIHPDDLYLAKRLMERALEARTGQPVLPYDLEQALEGIFEGVSLDYPDESGHVQETLPDAGELPPQKPVTFCRWCGMPVHFDGVLWRLEEDRSPDCGKNPDGTLHDGQVE